MNAREAIAYIENFTWSTTRLGLQRTRELLHAIGDPHQKLKFVHVAGSNGKGSACAMLDSILRTAGYRTGLYTSPYIQDFCERIQVNGKNIPGEDLARITGQVQFFADQMDDHPSQFELVTAIAMQFFLEQNCDVVVLEVGMGGELDSTNVISCPEAAVIMNIGLEHTEYLGNTLEKIAAAKGGIIKPGCTAVCYDSEPAVMKTLEEICKEKGADFRISGAEDLEAVSHSLEGQSFRWKGEEYFTSLLGPHQIRNAGTVLETVSALRDKGWVIPEAAVSEGLRDVRWPARFEVLRRDPLFILDGGHNPQCAEALSRNLNEYLNGKTLTFLIGVLADKDYRQMLRYLLPFAKKCICVTPDSPRALPASELAREIQSMGTEAVTSESIENGVQEALACSSDVVAFGSLYLAGHVRTVFPKALKGQQRKTALARRNALTAAQREAASVAICETITRFSAYQNAKTIFLYHAFGSEADLSELAERAKRDGKTVLYPYCQDETRMLALLPGKKWKTGSFGIEEPVLEDSSVFPPDEIDLVLCPCSAFDADGHRLGMGRGYYDRFLPQCTKAFTALTAFEVQCLDQVCTEGNDVPVNAVVTEKRVLFYP